MYEFQGYTIKLERSVTMMAFERVIFNFMHQSLNILVLIIS